MTENKTVRISLEKGTYEVEAEDGYTESIEVTQKVFITAVLGENATIKQLPAKKGKV